MEDETVCCPKFNPENWDDKIFEWTDKKFIKAKVFTFFYIPVNFGSVMAKFQKIISKAGVKNDEFLCLSDHTSKWNMDLFLAVDEEIDGAVNTKMSGKFFSKVYEGPFSDTEKWARQFQADAKSKGFKIKKWYMWYTTCPKCAKKYGKNYVVIIAEI